MILGVMFNTCLVLNENYKKAVTGNQFCQKGNTNKIDGVPFIRQVMLETNFKNTLRICKFPISFLCIFQQPLTLSHSCIQTLFMKVAQIEIAFRNEKIRKSFAVSSLKLQFVSLLPF